MSTTIKRPNSKPHSKPKNGVLAAQKTSIVPEESMEEDSMEEDEEQELESDENEGSEDEDDENGYEQEEYEPLDDDDSLDDVFGMEGLDDEPEPLSKEALEAYQAAQARAGVIYISRIPPGMNPNKVRHLMSAYGEIGRVFLQQEGKLVCRFNDHLMPKS
jgi:ESF2/ABP1 family protein